MRRSRIREEAASSVRGCPRSSRDLTPFGRPEVSVTSNRNCAFAAIGPSALGAAPGADIVSICTALRAATTLQRGGPFVRSEPHPERDQLLREYRKAVLARVHHDARINYAELVALLRETSTRCGADLAQTPLGADLLARLESGVRAVTSVDPCRDGRTEEKWLLGVLQFHLDGLYLADRLLAVSGHGVPSTWQHAPRWVEFLGGTAPGWIQGLVSVLEGAVPDMFRANPLRTYGPTLAYLLAHSIVPNKRFRFMDLLATTRGWLRPDGFARLRG